MLDRVEGQILRRLLLGPATFWQLIREQDGHLARYVEVMEDLARRGLIRSEGGSLSLTSRGRDVARREGISPLEPSVCPTCEGKTVVLEGRFGQVLKEFKEIARLRPQAIAEYDQGYVDAESTVSRVALMYQRGDLENKDIFLIGDDDLTSIAMALTGMTGRIAVLEVDERLVDFINENAGRRSWNNLTAYKYDVRQPLPPEFRAAYDTFLIDPVETLPGISLFLCRCAESLKGRGSAGYFGLTHLEASRDKWYRIQKLILEMNFVITDIIHNFHAYELEREGFVAKNYPLVTRAFERLPVPDINWYTSNFFRLEAVAQPRVPQDAHVPWGRELYFDEEAYATLP